MAKLVFIFAAICICQVLGKPSAGHEENLKELGQEIHSLGDTLHKELSKIIQLPDAKQGEEINKKLEHGVSEVADAMTKVVQYINKEVQTHSPEAEKMFKDMRTKFETEVEKIKKEHPQETAKIKEYQKKIEDMYNKVSADTQKVIEKVTKDTEEVRGQFGHEIEEFAKLLKTNMEHVGKQMKDAIEKHQKGH